LPEWTEPPYYLGVALAERWDWEGAVAALSEAVRLRPRHAMRQYRLGQALEMKGEYQRALECYRNARKLDSKDPNIRAAFENLSWRLQHFG
jgi:tetratricopeptide (TPR) repeat protein